MAALKALRDMAFLCHEIKVVPRRFALCILGCKGLFLLIKNCMNYEGEEDERVGKDL
jgi:hypothetical protein